MGIREISVGGYSVLALSGLIAGGAFAWKYLEDYREGLVSEDLAKPESESYFNLHVLLMYWLYLLPNALGAISFRAFTFIERDTAKLLHALFNTIGFAASIAGFVIIYKHQGAAYGEYGHFYSPHTYIGMITLALYWFQWVAGVFLYFISWEKFLSSEDLMRMGKIKGAFIQSHRAIGYICFVLIAVSCFFGFITNYYYGFTKGDPNHDMNSIMPYMNQSMVPMFVGMMLLLAVILNTKYVRPKPKEVYKPQETATLKSVSPIKENVSAPPTSDF